MIRQPDPDVILQKQLVEYSPWHMLVGCVLLNLTNRKQVDKMIVKFFDTWSDPESAASLHAEHRSKIIKELLEPLGLGKRRFETLKLMSRHYLELLQEAGFDVYSIEPKRMHGVGLYAWQSWEIFVMENSTSLNLLDVKDKKLLEYLMTKKDAPSI